MEKRQLGTSQIQITPIIMGTWQAGKRMWVGIEDAETVKAMRAAFEAGITTFDTAEVTEKGIRNKLSVKHFQMCDRK
jgi:aryl-alcohol dehydrogenase-like predicted oxidoreductase